MEPDKIEDGGDVVDSIEQAVAEDPFVELLGSPTRVKMITALYGAMTPLNPHDIAESAAISRNAFYDNRDVLLEDFGVIEQVGTAGNSPLYELADTELVTALEKVIDYAGAERRDRLKE